MKIAIIILIFFTSSYAVSLAEKVDYLNNVKELIVLTQTLRGNTNVNTKGEQNNTKGIQENRQEVLDSLKKLHTKFERVDVSVDKEFKKLHKYMKDLNEVASELDALVTFRANSLLIKEMLRLGVEVQKSFFDKESALNKEASAMMMQKILPMTEYLGQLRGLSAGAVACRHCNDDEDLEYIKDYLALMADDLDSFIIQMRDLQERYPKAYTKDLKLNAYEKELRDFLVHIEELVVERREEKEGECDLFTQGTKVINKTLAYYKMNEAVIK